MDEFKRFLLIDDHSIVRLAVRLMLKTKYPNAVIDEAADGKLALELTKLNEYDLFVVDLVIPLTDTLKLLQGILTISAVARILVFTMVAGEVYANRCYQLGVKGFLTKDCEEEEIGKAIEVILGNRKFVSASLFGHFMEQIIEEKPDNPFDFLSKREKDIVQLLIKGVSVVEITKQLGIKSSTVGTYKARVFDKLKVANIVDLHQLARIYHFI